jgi:hypothetical protein
MRPLTASIITAAILGTGTPAVAADWVLWEKTSWIGVRMNEPDKITTIGVYPTKPTCAAAALKLAKELAATKPDSLAFPFVEGPRAGAGAAYVWNATTSSPPYSEFYEATCWPVGVNPK